MVLKSIHMVTGVTYGTKLFSLFYILVFLWGLQGYGPGIGLVQDPTTHFAQTDDQSSKILRDLHPQLLHYGITKATQTCFMIAYIISHKGVKYDTQYSKDPYHRKFAFSIFCTAFGTGKTKSNE